MSVGTIGPQQSGGGESGPASEQGWFGERLRWQSVLFAQAPLRRDLLALHAPWPLTGRRIRVHRNHAVEGALNVARPYLELAGIAPDWRLGAYDDSLDFGELESEDGLGGPDAEVVWLDFERFTGRLGPAELGRWLGHRLGALRTLSSAPILVLDWDAEPAERDRFAAALADALAGIPDVRVADRSAVFAAFGSQLVDLERASLTGTRMSAVGAFETGRRLGGRWLPALLAPRLKAVVVDLDHTLYSGVLGEDGVDGVVLSAAHAQLQRRLAALRESGMFLGLLSRNERSDVERLFGERIDFPLRLDQFDAVNVDWEPKSAGLAAITRTLRIDPGAVLFVDDNAGELLEALMGNPGLGVLHADADAAATLRALERFPGLWAFERTQADALRGADLRAGETRARALAGAGSDMSAYYRELAVRLSVTHNQAEQFDRVAELSGKTNQFNLALARWGVGEIRRLAADGGEISTVALEDRLTDSGVIAFAIKHRVGDRLIVDELCISCRALGRRLEDLIVAQLLVSGPAFAGTGEIELPLLDGPRNAPARRWLSTFAGRELPAAPERITVVLSPERVRSVSTNPNVLVRVSP